MMISSHVEFKGVWTKLDQTPGACSELRLGRGGCEALIIGSVTEGETGLRCTPISAETHGSSAPTTLHPEIPHTQTHSLLTLYPPSQKTPKSTQTAISISFLKSP